jgi:hypothetical protein
MAKNQFTLPKINSHGQKSIHMAKNQFRLPKIKSDCQKLIQIAKKSNKQMKKLTITTSKLQTEKRGQPPNHPTHHRQNITLQSTS